MATYYVSPTGNDANTGLTWAQRKLTLNGVEDIPVAANDTVYVAPGVYRELLTCDVSGGAGQPITYIGDVTGEHTDGIGGVVRITGSDNDQTATRASCITGTTCSYRTFRGFAFDSCTSHLLSGGADSRENWIIEDCNFQTAANVIGGIAALGASQSTWTVRRCAFIMRNASYGVLFSHGAAVDNAAHVVENCTFVVGSGVRSVRVGGFTVRNCVFIDCTTAGVIVGTALTVGQVITVNGCIIAFGSTGLSATALGEIVEDYNCISGNATARTNVAVGANSNSFVPLFDLGILHSGAGQVSGFKLPKPQLGALSAWSQIRAIADGGTNAALDITGLTRPVTDGKRSWGAVQYQNEGRETATTHGGGLALRLDDCGRRQFWIPYPGDQTEITVSVWGYYEANYAGNLPRMIIKQPGQADRVTAMAGGAGAWEELTDTFTPNHKPDWICVELVSENTDAANPATNDAFFDDLTVVAIGSLGDMETWLWDTEVSDWVAYAGGGGACDYPAEEDVEDGVVYGSGAYTGTLVCGRRCARFPDMELCKRRGMP